MTIYRPGQHIYYPGARGIRYVQPGGGAGGVLGTVLVELVKAMLAHL